MTRLFCRDFVKSEQLAFAAEVLRSLATPTVSEQPFLVGTGNVA